MFFVAGVISEYYGSFKIPLFLPIVGTAMLLGAFLVERSIKFDLGKAIMILTAFLFFVFGSGLARLGNDLHDKNFFLEHEGEVRQVRIIEPPTRTEKSIKCLVSVDFVDRKPTRGKALFYTPINPQSEKLKYGDVLLTTSRFNRVKSNGNPFEFDYPEYLKTQNIFCQAFAREHEWVVTGSQKNKVMSGIFYLRDKLLSILDGSSLKPENKQIAKALLLGQRHELSEEVAQAYTSAGATHILAVSGLHVGILMLILGFVLKPLKRLPRGKVINMVLVVSGLWLYALLTGMSPSVMRAATMFSFIVVGKELQRETSIYQSILASAFILVLFDPYVIFEVGFQLSYSAVIGIVYLQPKIYNLLYVRWWLPDKLWQITSVSIAAQLATLPLVLYYFHQFPNYFWLTNLIVIPGAFFVLMVGLTFLAVSWIPFLSEIVVFLLDLILTTMNSVIGWIEGLPMSVSNGFWLSWYEVLIFYTMIILAAFGLFERRKKAIMASLTLGVLLLTISIGRQHILRSENQIVFYNTGKYDAIDIFYGDNNLFFYSGDLMENKTQLSFSVLQHWYQRKGDDKPGKAVSIEQVQRPAKIGKNSLLFLDQAKIDSGKIGLTDWVYLREIKYIPEELITQWNQNAKKVILGSDISWKTKNFIRYSLDESKLVDLQEGAAIYAF